MEYFKDIIKPPYCKSNGRLISQNKDCVVIAPHIAGEKNADIMIQGCGDLTIPKKAIIQITNLRKK